MAGTASGKATTLKQGHNFESGGICMKLKTKSFLFLFLVLLVACAPQVRLAPYSYVDVKITPGVQAERDEIYMLAAYGVVLNDWQDGSGKKRGHVSFLFPLIF